MKQWHALKTVNSIIFYCSCLLLLAACWQRNDFPEDLQLDARLLQEPVQKPVQDPAFAVSRGGVQYRVEPLYSYDLYGVVVSFEHHDGNYSLHRLWNDHLNVADICVVWGGNAEGVDLNRIRFWNGAFTCNYQTSDQVVWERFSPEQISNNHLLIENPHYRKLVQRVRIGDQVRVRGWLASYSNDTGFARGTSSTRTDQGDGACETIYVKEFSILRSMDNGWRTLLTIALLGFTGSALTWVIAVARGVF